MADRSRAVDILVALGGDRESAELLVAIWPDALVEQIIAGYSLMRLHGAQAEVNAAIVERAGATIQ